MAAGAMLDVGGAAAQLGSGSNVGLALVEAEERNHAAQMRRKAIDKQWARCARLPLQLVVTIPLPTFSLKEVLAMRKGQRILSNWSSRDDVPLMAGDTFVANVTFEPAGSSLGVRISGFQSKAPALTGVAAPTMGKSDGAGKTDPGRTLSEEESDREHTMADIRLPVSLCFGWKTMLLPQILELTSGDAIVLERPLNGPVSVVIARRVVGQGELISVKGLYGIRLQKLAELSKRLPEWHPLK